MWEIRSIKCVSRGYSPHSANPLGITVPQLLVLMAVSDLDDEG